ncbi:TrkA-N domain-containing protein [Calderihabitans maritimus]|uniref:TrkA-N domain-containing protein n=2 Tax=Calderihabitans maritimus TaxID=1246530 RepID=A0A1Z5HQD4_9FIRM|nr:TrkA-N domain-containing protein [Calderihabitans maritimus]
MQAFFLLLLIIATGVLGYLWLEDMSFLDTLWLTITGVTTVGYGDIVPVTPGGRVFTLFLNIAGVGLFLYAVSNVTAFLIEGHLKNELGRRKTMRAIEKLSNHIIVCGAGRVGNEIIFRLRKEKVPFVVVESDPQKVAELSAEGVLCVEGDATSDAVLEQAGIHRAVGLVTSLPDDAANVFVTLTSKGLNPRIKVVARSNRPETEEKLLRAGADKVVSPSAIGGRRMAISILKPASVDFIETLMHDQDLEFELEEVTVSSKSSLVGKELRHSGIKQEASAMVVAIKRGEKIINNPPAHEKIQAGDLLIVIGTRSQMEKLERMVSGD